MKEFITLLLLLTMSISVHAQDLMAVYVLSEGGFNAGSSSLSKLEISKMNFTKNYIKGGNLGAFPDGMVIHGTNLYLTEQGNFGGPGKIYKLDTEGNILASREVGTNPYSMTITNGKIYITNGPASSVSVIKESDLSDVKTISVGAYPQEIISFEGKVFVSNNSLYGGASDSTVSVIDSDTDEIINTINGKRDPNSFSSISIAISNDSHLLFACPGSETEAIIYKVNIETFVKVDSFKISGYGLDKDICVDKNSNKLFFKSVTNEIVQLDMDTKNVIPVVSDQNLISINGYAYEHTAGHHYIADAKDFVSNGSLVVYNSDGTLLKDYETSTSPRRVILEYDESAVNIDDEFILSDFNLGQNYPNPFNPSTTIKYSLPTPPLDGVNGEWAMVNLVVYDLLGREVVTLVEENQKPGSYEVIFEPSADGSSSSRRITSGIYFYRLSAGKYNAVKKMMLLK